MDTRQPQGIFGNKNSYAAARPDVVRCHGRHKQLSPKTPHRGLSDLRGRGGDYRAMHVIYRVPRRYPFQRIYGVSYAGRCIVAYYRGIESLSPVSQHILSRATASFQNRLKH